MANNDPHQPVAGTGFQLQGLRPATRLDVIVMRQEYRVCDKCKATRVPDGMVVFAATDRVTDAAGSAETCGKELDLCHACAIACLSRLLKMGTNSRVPDYNAGRLLIDFIKA